MNNGWTGGQYSIFRVILGICVGVWSVATILPLPERRRGIVERLVGLDCAAGD